MILNSHNVNINPMDTPSTFTLHKSNEKKSDFADFNITMPILI